MLINQTESNKYFGKMLIGRIQQGKLNVGDRIQAVGQDGEVVEQSKVMKISKKFGMHELDLQTAYAGDIVSIAGFANGTVGHTLNNMGQNHVIPAIPIDPPTLSLTLTFNDSPLKGNDGDKLTIS
jgi:GTP-binding protein